MKRFLSVSGFTLMELMIVVIIVGILVTIALPSYYRSVERSRMSEAYMHLSAIREAQLAYYNRYQTYAGNIANLQVDNPNDLPAVTRYFNNYGILISISVPLTQGFTGGCVRNNNNNALGFNYYIWMNQDGQIDTNFYSSPD